MNTLSLITGALIQRFASASVQPQSEGNPQAHPFTLPEAAQHALQERLRTGAEEHQHADKRAKQTQQDETAPPSLDLLMTMLLMPERPAAAENSVQAALPDRIAQATLPVQMMQSAQLMPVEGATPRQLAEQVRLTVEHLPAIASLGKLAESPRPERPTALHHAVSEKSAHERSEPASLAANPSFIADDTRFLPGKMQPERTVSVDTRAAQWGDALVHILKENIHFQLGQQQQISTIRLDPPSLGKLEIAIQLDAGKLTVHISASQADVCRTLQQCGDALRLQLTQQNFVQVEVQVSPDGQSQSQSQSRQQRDDRQTSPQILSAVELDAEEVSLKSRDPVLIKV